MVSPVDPERPMDAPTRRRLPCPMNPVIGRLQKVWWAFDIPGYRSIEATYEALPWSEVPPLTRAFDGSLDWYLRPIAAGAPAPTLPQAQDPAAAEAIRIGSERGYSLPADYVRFLSLPSSLDLFAGSPT